MATVGTEGAVVVADIEAAAATPQGMAALAALESAAAAELGSLVSAGVTAAVSGGKTLTEALETVGNDVVVAAQHARLLVLQEVQSLFAGKSATLTPPAPPA